MAKERRPAREQSRHDEAIRRSAAQYKARGYNVQADVPGYKRPDAVGGRRPDLIVRKGRDKKIIEVETPNTLSSDRAQQQALRRGAERMGADFRVVVAKPRRRGKR